MTKPKSRLPILAGPSIHRSREKAGKRNQAPPGQQKQRKYGVLALL